jgi:hypothetical protein
MAGRSFASLFGSDRAESQRDEAARSRGLSTAHEPQDFLDPPGGFGHDFAAFV